MLRWKLYRVNMLKRKPYFLLLFLAILFVLLCLFHSGNSIIDINIYDTYYVMSHCHFYGFMFVIVFTLFTFYWSFEKAKIQLITILSKIHIYGTLILIVGLFFPYSWVFPVSNFPLYDNLENANICLTYVGLLFLFLQILFIINIFVFIIKKLSNSFTQNE